MTICASCGHESAETFKFCPECGTPATEPSGREQRKTVTVLFCDVTGSTAMGESTDPEALRALLARYFERMKEIVETHGGTVEKFIGDAVMAVFGVPQLHEDDALRACRAAVEMRDALPELGVEARIGLNTGEVVTGTEERLATGDAVNVAARLEQAAAPGEILMGEETLRLVREAVEVQEVEPLALKGKSEPVPAFRLLDAGEPARRHQAPMVGRVRELDRLRDAYEQAVENRSCQLFTILGTAGVGKSRLVSEFLNDLDATVVRGRCLSYGVGITYWALVEALLQLGVRPPDERAAATLASVLGETTTPTTPDEIAWAARKTLEAAASEQPLVCVFDDIHWAEPAFLDLVEHVADFSRGFPILLLCIARPELLDRRTGWGGGKLNATTVLLEPLSAQETDDLIDRLADLDESLKERIRTAAEGNPLFVEEMLAMVREAGNGEVAVPPTIHALLAARLDQLDAAERTVLERGAVEGKVFHRGAVEALTPDEAQVPHRLMSLVRKELVRPDTPQLPHDDAFRFRHLLIRDAAYEALPKTEPRSSTRDSRSGCRSTAPPWWSSTRSSAITSGRHAATARSSGCRSRNGSRRTPASGSRRPHSGRVLVATSAPPSTFWSAPPRSSLRGDTPWRSSSSSARRICGRGGSPMRSTVRVRSHSARRPLATGSASCAVGCGH